jgi:small subunit ribosomal protein S9
MTTATKKTTAKAAPKSAKPKIEVKASPKQEGRYYQGLGGRKTATASVRIYPKGTGVTVNGKELKEYFKMPKHQTEVLAPLEVAEMGKSLGVTVKVSGSGIHAQAQAVRNGIATALVALDKELKKKLKRVGFITRDPRVVERKKYGLKGARRSPQWSKR